MSDETPPIIASEPPKVIWWFKFFCVFGCFTSCIIAMLSLLVVMSIREGDSLGIGALLSLLAVFLFIGCLVTFSVNLIPLALSPRPWLWTYCLVLIIWGMMSDLWLIPVCIPLLVFWLKPETKRYFERTANNQTSALVNP